MAPDLSKVLSLGIEYGPRVVGLVKGVKSLFGGGKSGSEKKQIVKDSIAEGESIVEGISNRDLLNGDLAQTLVDESVEVAYQIMKLEERLRAIHAQLGDLKGSGTPIQ